MNHRYQPHYASDGDSLQTDVMRFMAIIAFCLIAILALVRNVEPPTEPATVEPEPNPVPAPRKPEVLRSFVEPLAKPEPMAPLPPKSTPVPAPAVAQVPILEIAAQVETSVASEQSAQSEQSEQSAKDEPGLSLRFASDRDFLRLVTKGEIQVFAYQARKVLGLDRNFEFLNADPPGQIYELLPETIPNLIVAALDRATPESGSYTWGIRMPKKLEGKIRGFIDREVHGELVIDRYGEVHHVAS